MFRHLLVPTDGSTLSRAAVGKAVSFARETNAHVTFLYVASHSTESLYGEDELSRTLDPVAHAQRGDEAARSVLDPAVAESSAAGVTCDSRTVTASEPWEGIVALAEECGCDLIVMASHGYSGIKKVLLGSQTQSVLIQSKLPVLVFR